MDSQCYYCQHDAGDKVYYITIYEVDDEHDEPLCDSCYKDWLESMKD